MGDAEQLRLGGGREPTAERIDRILEGLPDHVAPYVHRAVFLTDAAPTKAAARARQLRGLIDSTDEGDLGWESELAALEGALGSATRCADCGRPLTDPTSIERGIGPDCWSERQEQTP